MELLRELIRARALETLLARRLPRSSEGDAILPVSPAVPAARTLRGSDDGRGDLFTLRVGSPAAALSFGATPAELLRQRLGKATAPASGRDAGGFPTDLSRGLLAPVSTPGTLVEVAAGAALAFRLRNESRVALVVDDRAGSASGDWHEGLNLAVVQRAPLVLVVQGAAATPASRGLPHLEARAGAYGFTSHTVGGQDPREVEKVIWSAVEAARTGDGVQVVEVGLPGREPVDWLVEHLAEAGGVNSETSTSLIRDADAEMEAALEAVEQEPDPDLAAVLDPHGPERPRGWTRWAAEYPPLTLHRG